jgi:hypothetical protein
MRTVLLASALVIAGCGKKGSTTPKSDGSGSGTDSGNTRARRMTLSWGLSPGDGGQTEVYLAATDERGGQVSHPMGTYPGTCQPVTPTPQAMLSVICKNGATGIEIDVLQRPDRVIVTKLRVDDGVAVDYSNREPFTEVMAPGGALIEAGR